MVKRKNEMNEPRNLTSIHRVPLHLIKQIFVFRKFKRRVENKLAGKELTSLSDKRRESLATFLERLQTKKKS